MEGLTRASSKRERRIVVQLVGRAYSKYLLFAFFKHFKLARFMLLLAYETPALALLLVTEHPHPLRPTFPRYAARHSGARWTGPVYAVSW